MTKSRTGPTNRVGALGVVVAALGLLLGMAFVSPAGAQDDDPYTGVLGLDLEPVSYTHLKLPTSDLG